MSIAKRACHRKAVVAVARKLAVIMHAMWSTAPAMSAIRRQANRPGRVRGAEGWQAAGSASMNEANYAWMQPRVMATAAV